MQKYFIRYTQQKILGVDLETSTILELTPEELNLELIKTKLKANNIIFLTKL